MSSLVVDLAVAAVPFAVMMAITWRLVWPRWKLPGKFVFYFAAVAGLSWALGHWSLAFAFAHQTVGLTFHIWFCRKHGFTWYAVEDPARYRRLSKVMVGAQP